MRLEYYKAIYITVIKVVVTFYPYKNVKMQITAWILNDSSILSYTIRV